MGLLDKLRFKSVKETNLEGIEEGLVVSSVDNTWTKEDGLFEIADNKVDIGATVIKFVKGYDEEKEQFYLEYFHNGKKFDDENDFTKFMTSFIYHNPHGEKETISLKGVGRRYASYVLSGYAKWGKEGTSEYFAEALDNEGYLNIATLTIRKPEQKKGDVKFGDRIKVKKWKEWWVCHEIQYLDNDIDFNIFISDLTTSYPNKQNVEFVFEDQTTGETSSHHCYDPTYAVKFLDKEYDYLWNDAKKEENGITIDESEDGPGYFVLRWFKAPCGTYFKGIVAVLSTDFIREQYKKDSKKEEAGARGISHHRGGIYVYRGGRLINRGNTKHLAPKLSHDRGGVGNCRLLIDLSDNNVANDFGISGNKSNGICSIERSEKLNPNRTGLFDTTVGDDRFKDKWKSENFIPGLYDYFIDCYNTAYHDIYCEKLSRGCGKNNNIESKNTPKTNSKKQNKKDILTKIGKATAVTTFEAETENKGISRYDIIESEEFSDIVDEILDFIEVNGMKIDGNTHDNIISYLRDNTLKTINKCKDLNVKALSS